RNFRRERADAYYFNWILKIDHQFQQPFVPSHENVAALDLDSSREPHLLAADLRRAFSAIVAGNVKDDGIRRIEQQGPFRICGESAIMQALDGLLHGFVEQGRMKVPGKAYTPCYSLQKQ
ncbi:MAG TPA: pyrimidine/purine nucleotide monophosphate nucleosidase domain-containing protein, partial [Gammaproteobacteria bacterium]|nr:pyrimidine/purine nucleotide monophosphate nucleosidase domain-containing protein [Gammaproteobacteria bacterium]